MFEFEQSFLAQAVCERGGPSLVRPFFLRLALLQ